MHCRKSVAFARVCVRVHERACTHSYFVQLSQAYACYFVLSDVIIVCFLGLLVCVFGICYNSLKKNGVQMTHRLNGTLAFEHMFHTFDASRITLSVLRCIIHSVQLVWFWLTTDNVFALCLINNINYRYHPRGLRSLGGIRISRLAGVEVIMLLLPVLLITHSCDVGKLIF